MRKIAKQFIKLIILITALLVLGLFVIIFPRAIITDVTGYYRPVLYIMYLTAPPFFYALYLGFSLLQERKSNVFVLSLLQRIQICTAIIGIIYAFNMPFIFRAGDLDDAPGAVLIGLIFTLFPILISVFVGKKRKRMAEEMGAEL